MHIYRFIHTFYFIMRSINLLNSNSKLFNNFFEYFVFCIGYITDVSVVVRIARF